ncbi:MAG: DUF1648 domain-containing protein [Oscillospiraceae bacterium]|jgi:uncharacterized membrane protein|nr:DUF1648 domain-containing protein [Oscillospiraceae bacterium]
MKINWKKLIITSLIALSPVILGVVLLPQLPDTVAIHWDNNNEANGWVSKHFAVFGLPALMALLQIILCVSNDLQSKEGAPKIQKIALWVVPIISVLLYSVTMYIALGKELDIRLIACLIVGAVFILFGNYLPKVPQEQNGKLMAKALPPEKYRKVMKRIGVVMMVFGVLFLLSLFLRPVVSSVLIVLMVLFFLVITIVSFIKK